MMNSTVDMLPFVLAALTLGLLATVSLVLGAYRVGRTSGEESARVVFANLVQSTRDELARAREIALLEKERQEELAAELERERMDRKRADDERRVFASESFNAKLELRRAKTEVERLTSQLADQWAAIEDLRYKVEKDDVASGAPKTTRDTTGARLTPTKQSPIMALEVS